MSFTRSAVVFVVLVGTSRCLPVEEPYPEVAGEINRWRDPDPDDCPQLMHVDNPYEPIPERPTTRIASASFISKCYLGRVDFLSLKSPSLRLPTGELVTKVSGSSYTWDGVTWHTATYTARNKVVVLNFLQNIRHFSGLMGDFSVRLSYGSRSFYVSYGDEEVGILYGVLWLGDQAVIVQTCGKDCAMWCDLKEEQMWQMDGWVNG